MELILLGAVPVLFLLLATIMMVVSEVSGFFTFRWMSARQQAANQLIAAFIQKMKAAQKQLARRSAELESLSARLQLSNQELERLNTLKSRFLSMAAHDMRTPLASIRGFAGMLSEQKTLRPKDRRYVENIQTATEQMGRLTSDLTDLAMIEAGKLNMEPAPFDVTDMVERLMPGLALLGAKRDVAVDVTELPPALEIVGDRFRLGQVLSNLVGNAIKFTPSGGYVELKVRAGGGGVMFVVADTGPGIHPTEREKIFEKFYQAQKGDTVAAKRQGWGLGLSIAQEIVRAHGGDIGVESAGLGKGSKFWFFVPSAPGIRTAGRGVRQALITAAAALLCLLPGAGFGQSLPLDDKARYDKFLEEKADNVILKILGPNRGKVVVDATIDFTRVEKFQLLTAEGEEKKDGKPPALFAWQNLTAQQSGAAEFLPGIPTQQPDGPKGQPQSYERSSGFTPAFIKRLAVTIILDKTVKPDEEDAIRRIVLDLLEVDENRGDAFTVVRAAFAPAWKTIWYSPDSFSMIFRYSLLALMTLITLIVVASCFIRLANAMDSMAKAQSNYGMNLSGGTEDLQKEGEEAEQLEKKEDEEEEKGEEEVIIEVKEDQLETLVTMLQGEDPDNVALVLTHLNVDMRKAFLAKLPAEPKAAVLARLADVRFVEPGVVEGIKEEIERRLAGAVGGLHRVFQIIDDADPAAKREILQALEATNPELARNVRSRVLLMEDLMKMGPQDWALLMGRIRIEDWAAALKEAPPELRLMLRSQMMPKTWAILEQTMKALAISPERILQAQSVILGEVWKMIQAGQIRNPLENAGALPGPEAPAEPVAA